MRQITLRLICFILLITQFSVFNLAQRTSQLRKQPDYSKLTLRPIERELKAGEVHTYSLQLEAGQSAEIIVDQDNVGENGAGLKLKL